MPAQQNPESRGDSTHEASSARGDPEVCVCGVSPQRDPDLRPRLSCAASSERAGRGSALRLCPGPRGCVTCHHEGTTAQWAPLVRLEDC